MSEPNAYERLAELDRSLTVRGWPVTVRGDGPWDVLMVWDVDPDSDDDILMGSAVVYDYGFQRWHTGVEHAHFRADDGPLFRCTRPLSLSACALISSPDMPTNLAGVL